MTDDEEGVGRSQLLVANSSTTSIVFAGRFNARLLLDRSKALTRVDYKVVTDQLEQTELLGSG